MMKINTFALGAVLLAAGAGQSLAADYRAPVKPAPQFSWSGPYVGATAGYAWGSGVITATGFGPSLPISTKGFVGSAEVGYNFQAGGLVLGIEADISNGPRGSNPQGTPAPVGGGIICNTGVCYVNVDYFGTVRGRLGFAADHWLVYATGGLAYGQISAGVEGGGATQNGSATHLGWTAGGGAEYALTKNWSAKVEYLYVNLGSVQTSSQPFVTAVPFNVVRGGINYNFGK